MPKLKTLSGAQVCRILEKYGFVEVRRKGSHIAMQKKVENTTITIPVPNHKELKKGTLSSIIRQSGIPKQEFQK